MNTDHSEHYLRAWLPNCLLRDHFHCSCRRRSVASFISSVFKRICTVEPSHVYKLLQVFLIELVAASIEACIYSMQSRLVPEVRCFTQLFRRIPSRTSPKRLMASALRNETPEQRKARKDEVKAQKAEKRARREGHVPDDYGQKPCSLCEQQKDLLIRQGNSIEETCCYAADK